MGLATSWCWLLVLFSFAITTGGEMELMGTERQPEFLAPLENHTVTQGRDVAFTCSVNHLRNYRVAWIKSDSKAILAIHTSMVALDPRLSVTYNGHNTWRLHVASVQANDSGTYMCQVNTVPMKSQQGRLAVLVPPDIDDSGGAGEATVREGGNVRLACAAIGVPPPTVVWRREGGRLINLRHHDHARERKAVYNFSGSVLELQHVQRGDMGSYYCIASNGVPPSVSRRHRLMVHFFPSIRVSNQLVGAPLGSEVQLQCYVEASPRAMNSWYRDNGDKVADGAKYRVREGMASEYAVWSNLTIRSLDRRDLGGYVCAAANALGRVEANVRVHRLDLPDMPVLRTATGGAGRVGTAALLLVHAILWSI